MAVSFMLGSVYWFFTLAHYPIHASGFPQNVHSPNMDGTYFVSQVIENKPNALHLFVTSWSCNNFVWHLNPRLY